MKTLELSNLTCTQVSETKDSAKKRVVVKVRMSGTFTPGSINSPIPSGRLDLTIADYGMVAAKVDDAEGTVAFTVSTHVAEGEMEELAATREHGTWLMDSPPHDAIAEYQGVLVQRGLDLGGAE